MTETHKTLTTRRFVLEPLRQEDAPKLADLGADPDVVKNLIFDWSTAERRLEIARLWIRHHEETGIWGVFDRDDIFGAPDRFVGFLAVDRPLPRGGLGPEVYYAFRQDTWGQGVATEVVRASAKHLYEDRGARAVEALVLAGLNPASTRLLEKLGMGLVGRYPLADYVGSACRPTMDYELWRIETALPERAEQALKEAAFKIGQFVADGVASIAEMTGALEKAAAKCGLAARLDGGPTAGLIGEYLEDGMKETGWLHYRMTSNEFVGS